MIRSTRWLNSTTLSTRSIMGGRQNIYPPSNAGLSRIINSPGGDVYADIVGVGGIPSAEAVGNPSLTVNIVAVGIANTEAVGQPTVAAVVKPTGIASGEIIGQPTIASSLQLSGIASAEVVGQPSITVSVQVNGIPSEELVGTPTITVSMTLVGIVSGEHVGVPSVSTDVNLIGIPSGEFVGQPSITIDLGLQGVVSSEQVGTPTLTWESQTWTIQCIGIESEEALGVPVIMVVPDLSWPPVVWIPGVHRRVVVQSVVFEDKDGVIRVITSEMLI